MSSGKIYEWQINNQYLFILYRILKIIGKNCISVIKSSTVFGTIHSINHLIYEEMNIVYIIVFTN